MKVNELEPGKKFTLEASNDESHMQLKGTIANVTAEKDIAVIKQIKKTYQELFFCIADPIHAEECLVMFDSDMVSCNMIAILEGDKPYGWNNVRIMNMKLPVYGPVLMIASKADAASYNRRQNYRVFIGVQGTIDLEDGSEPKTTLVKDVSASGVGLISQTGDGLTRGDLITVEFHEAESGIDFKLKAAVVRNDVMDDGRYNIGCLLKSNSDVVARFVYDKQKKKMKGAEGSKPAENAEDKGDA